MQPTPKPEILAWVKSKESEFILRHLHHNQSVINYSMPDRDILCDDQFIDMDSEACDLAHGRAIRSWGMENIISHGVSLDHGIPFIDVEPDYHCFAIHGTPESIALCISVISTLFGDIVYARINPTLWLFNDWSEDNDIQNMQNDQQYYWSFTVKNDYGS